MNRDSANMSFDMENSYNERLSQFLNAQREGAELALRASR